ncbi:Exostosin domain-containing protein [Caenorhabditis elegans]|uniref:Exostosin domain-containing protein n=1 Tax=Caenorhabditis elegans TaxID=6239 RepID=Q2AAC5_CAEEL|nr:Exostosin domain-containing protein [Caenorhabditis elegans]CCD71583.1 Exostosin domain-containing protein [Caenorhabditis elegans]|eukprot:NP_001041254.2 Uncharacterized protein CELE_F49H12.7 [Caenorhabditis elegans]
MTIPVAKPYPSGEGVEYPRNMYFFDNATNDEIVILEEQQHDPRVILLAQLRNCLFVPYRQTFKTNVPEVVYNDFTDRSSHWKDYVDKGGWKNIRKSHQLIAKLVANSIAQEYHLLAKIGEEQKCSFGLENIALHLRDVISMETFFTSLLF